MTDKEIIIDGVDVRGCKGLLYGFKCENICPSCPDINCKYNPNCDYKQLQREKQKNEELEKKFKQFFNIDSQDCWNLAFVMNEKAKYKQALREIGEMADWNCNKCKLNAWHCHSCKEVKLKEILQKVKEVTE